MIFGKDFEGNLGIGSFSFELSIKLKNGEEISYRTCGEREDSLDFIVYTSPKQLASAKTIDQLVEMIKICSYINGDKEKPYFGSNFESIEFLNYIKTKIESMDEIESITIFDDHDTGYNLSRWFEYDLLTKKYLYKEIGDVEEIEYFCGSDFLFSDFKEAIPCE